ncbi:MULTISPECIES: hypothetical protein [unclassified Gemella]|uniref:hypothetical protein n=1 Tax=unclassified Gemella TaxID=2624949 RepID=UPI001C044993|nr:MULTISPECIES: hypothetical protein [unclassified Gemella]MBU0279394.1 hypothetical protein [Gemella sp. zg-1178]QWQ39290.1 hypothetical protein KMP11_02905 [Gemella sp. zg-570]
MTKYKDYIQLKDVSHFWRWQKICSGDKKEALEYIEKKREKFFKRLDCEPSRENLLKLCPTVQAEAYILGFLVSKAYSPEEIEEKKRYYLSLEPLPEANISINRWKHEVKRRFSSAGFNDYPDCEFCLLDTYRKLGRFYF